jgi:CRP-like cAMP-binding protein
MLDNLISAEGTSVSLARILQLKRFPLIGGLPASELAFVAEVLRERMFPKGTALMRSGEPVTSVYLVLDGRVRLARQGRDLGHTGRWGGVGGFSLFARDPDGADAVAETDVTALELEADALLELLEDRFAILRHVIREMCRTFIRLVQQHPPEREVRWRTAPGGPERDLDLVDRIVFFRQSVAFAGSSINALAELARWLSEQHVEPGTTLWREGEPARYASMIVTGVVSCTSADGGVGFRLGPGAPLGVVEAIAEVPRWYTAVAESPLVTLAGDTEGLLDVFEDNYAMALDYVAAVAREIVRLLERLADKGERPLRELYGCEEC